ncbi:MAG TPA: S26 family signal peptidase [Methanocorpusculum sp.]|nr:S26 family signal peptidase [Methanocorpusculum sp.]
MSFHDILHPKTEGGKTIRDIVAIILIVAIIGLLLFAISGTWPTLVAIESESMEPNIMTFSLAFVVEENRYGGWQTQEEAIASESNKMFNKYGDVLVYKPNGMEGVTPIIHRAIKRVTDEEAVAEGYNGGHAGIITKGDNNAIEDQKAEKFDRYGAVEPVKDEWIVGKALFAIPLIGWVPLNIIKSLLIAVAIVVILEIVSRIISKNKKKNTASRTEKREQTRRQQKKKSKQ